MSGASAMGEQPKTVLGVYIAPAEHNALCAAAEDNFCFEFATSVEDALRLVDASVPDA